jgi:hypothetical protein
MPANLDRPCPTGQAIPAGDVELRVLLPILAEREAAAAECRSMHDATRAGWPR